MSYKSEPLLVATLTIASLAIAHAYAQSTQPIPTTIAQTTRAGAAQAPKGIDPNALEISGVRIGMDWNEAFDAVKKFYNIDDSQIRFSTILNPENPFTHEKLPTSFSYEKDNTGLVVSFTSRLPPNPERPLEVWSIEYALFANTKQNAEALSESARNKYGAPSVGTSDSTSAEWCPKPTRNNLGRSECDRADQPVLMLRSNYLTLSDVSLPNKVRDYLKNLGNARPNF